MERYKDLNLSIPHARYKEFILYLRNKVVASNWELRDDLISSTFGDTDKSTFICIESPELVFNDTQLKGVIWILINEEKCNLEIINIVPLINKHLEYKEYNYILDCFRDNFLLDLLHRFNASIKESKAYYDLKDELGEDVFKALLMFSDCANKSTGNTHPMDFDRWCDFIFLYHHSNRHLSADVLIGWFKEEGWDEEHAHDLAIEFEQETMMLEKYNKWTRHHS